MLLDINPVMFSVGSFNIKYYSFFILLGVIISILLVIKEGSRFNIDKSVLFDLAFWVIIIGVIGARLYYVIFNFHLYASDPLSIFKIWEGGLAIHGGLLFGLLTAIIFCKKKNLDIYRILDISLVAVLLAQTIGRWGNFFNGEAHGAVTSLAYLESLHLPGFVIKGMLIDGLYYEPTFLYESVWCFIGFCVLLFVRRIKLIKKGMPTSFYLIWYGIGRLYIESLRTDSLMLGGFKVAQIVSVCMIIMGIIYLIFNLKKSKYENLYNSDQENIKSI